jgi:hypothetical protein
LPGHSVEAFDTRSINRLWQASGNLASEIRWVSGQSRTVEPGFNTDLTADIATEEAGYGASYLCSDPH